MELVKQIRMNFAKLSVANKRAIKLEGFEEEYSSWIIKFNNLYAVGIEIGSEVKINESFANVSYFTDWFDIGIKEKQHKHLLLIASSDKTLRNEFAGICALFLELGTNGEKRKLLLNNPVEWWKNWKQLLGNKSVEHTAHGVLGELITLYYLKQDSSFGHRINEKNWTGPNGKSVDIITDKKNYEVKSSVIKYNNIITISGQFQLDIHNNLSLMFVRLEKIDKEESKSNIISIDSMLQRLSKLGIDKDKLNYNICKLGFKENSLDRKIQYKLLELREYPVNKSFPIINMDSLRNISNMEHILQITYKIDLTGLSYRKIELNI